MKNSAELFKMLAVDKRIDIIELLKKEAMSVNALAVKLGITQSAVSQHLRVLKSADLVKDERQGYWIFYSLNKEALEECRKRLNRICTCGCSGEQSTKNQGDCSSGCSGEHEVTKKHGDCSKKG